MKKFYTMEAKEFKNLLYAQALVLLTVVMGLMPLRADAQNLKLKDINIRDPYILSVPQEGLYYMYASSSVTEDGQSYGGVVAYTSKDLENWNAPVRVFQVPKDNFLTGAVWAPEVHHYQGKYYLFATLNSDIAWKGPKEGHPPYNHRSTQIFWSDSPDGPFQAFENKRVHTPIGEMCLDGTLWVENGVPYMIYCHEWVEVIDGTMDLVELKPDLSGTNGQSIRLFCASAAEWSIGSPRADGSRTYVTDGCFLYRTKSGKLLMIWSSFSKEGYAVGIAESTTSTVFGPWRQQKQLLYNTNGGHGMLFKTFDGRLCMVLHSPNSPSRQERAHIFELEDTGDSLMIVGEVSKF